MKLRWGICSAGKISNDFVVALGMLPVQDHTVVAVAARSGEKARAFAQKHKIPVVHEGYEALAADSNVDVVYIGAVNHVHLPLCKLFLGHSKNVLCEKPLGLNKREVQEMVDLAKEKNVFFMEGWWTRFFPASVKLRDILAEGLIGEVKAVNASFGFALSFIERINNKDLGGGGLLDLGVYLAQEILMIFGQAPLSRTTTGFLADSGVDETTVTTLTFPNNAVATLTSSIVVQLPNDVQIRGTKGYVKVHTPFWCPTKLEVTFAVGKGDQEVNLMNADLKTEVYEFPLPKTENPFCYTNSAGLCYEAECVRECLMKGLKECPTASHKESLLVAEILEGARRDLGYVLPADL